MTKKQFLSQLDSALKNLPADERQDILQDYQEHFAIGMKKGHTEEEIAAALGSPAQIAKELLAAYHLEKVEATTSTGNILRAMWAVVGLGFVNLFFVLGPFIALTGIMVAGWVSGITLVLSPVIVIADTIAHPEAFQAFFLFISIMFCGLGLLVTVGMYLATKAVAKGFVRYLKFNMKIVKGGYKYD